MKKLYVKNNVVVAMVHINDKATTQASYVPTVSFDTAESVSDSSPVTNGWHRADPSSAWAPPSTEVVVDVPTFFMLFSPVEEANIRASTDPIVKVFLSRLDDSRTTRVNLSLTSVVQGIQYLTTINGPDGTTKLLTSSRANAILLGP